MKVLFFFLISIPNRLNGLEMLSIHVDVKALYEMDRKLRKMSTMLFCNITNFRIKTYRKIELNIEFKN